MSSLSNAKEKGEVSAPARQFDVAAAWEFMSHVPDNGTDGPLFGLAVLRITLAELSVMAISALPERWFARIK
jgi:hypothetical protein